MKNLIVQAALVISISGLSDAALVATWTAPQDSSSLGNAARDEVLLSPDTPSISLEFSATANTGVTDLTHVITLSGTHQAQLAKVGLPVVQGLDNVRGSTRKLVGSSFETLGTLGGTGNVTQRDATFDLFFSPDDLNDVRQLIFETGGSGAGIGLLMNGSTLTFGAAQNAANAANTSIDVGSLYGMAPDTDNMLQVRFSIDLGNDIIELSARNLSTGLGAASSATFTGADWAGSDDSGFFNFQGSTGGSAGGNIPGNYSNFDGQFAGLQFHTDAVLSAVPEPSTFFPMLAVLVSSICSHRRRRR